MSALNLLLVLLTSVCACFAAAAHLTPAEAGIAPTRSGQIGVNPVGFYPPSQYIPTIAPDNSVLTIVGGQTIWKSPQSHYFWARPVIKTIVSTITTIISPIQISASVASTASSGAEPGDVTLTIVPALKSKLDDFAEQAVQDCALTPRDSDSAEVNATKANALTSCLYGKAVLATAKGDPIGEAISGVELDTASLQVPEAAAAEIGLWAVALKIGQSELVEQTAWILSIVLSAYAMTGAVQLSYKIPVKMEGTPGTMAPTSTMATCREGAPTGVNAPVCRDGDCVGAPREKTCAVGEWKACSCLTAIKYAASGLVNPAFFVQQHDLLSSIDAMPEPSVECSHQYPKNYYNEPVNEPAEWCLCGLPFTPHTSFYPILPSPTAPCAYTILPPTQIPPPTPTRTPRPSLSECRPFTSETYTGCTCNDDFTRPYPTLGEASIGCDVYLPALETEVPNPAPRLLQGGELFCEGSHRGRWADRHYFSLEAGQAALEEWCAGWNRAFHKVGPQPMEERYVEQVRVGSGDNATDVYFSVAHFSDDGDPRFQCHYVDIGGVDRRASCMETFSLVLHSCDTVKEEGYEKWKQGGTFVKGCLHYHMGLECELGVCNFRGKGEGGDVVG